MSYENSWGAFTGQYNWSKGSQSGTYKVNSLKVVDVRDRKGFSLFGYVKVPWDKRFRVLGRYDYWDPDTGISNDIERRYIGGLSFNFYKGIMLVLDYEHDLSGEGDLSGANPKQRFFQTVLQIQY